VEALAGCGLLCEKVENYKSPAEAKKRRGEDYRFSEECFIASLLEKEAATPTPTSSNSQSTQGAVTSSTIASVAGPTPSPTVNSSPITKDDYSGEKEHEQVLKSPRAKPTSKGKGKGALKNTRGKGGSGGITPPPSPTPPPGTGGGPSTSPPIASTPAAPVLPPVVTGAAVPPPPAAAPAPAGSTGYVDPKEAAAAKLLEQRTRYVNRRGDYTAEEGFMPTTYTFYTPAPVDYLGRYALPLFTLAWLALLPDSLEYSGLFGVFLKMVHFMAIPFGIPVVLVRMALFAVFKVAFPEMAGVAGLAVFLALVNSVWVGRMLCKKGHIPVLDAYAIHYILRRSWDKTLRIFHTYTLAKLEKFDHCDHDTRPMCNARGNLTYRQANYGLWIYTQWIGGRVTKTSSHRISTEAVTQLCSNPRIMHLRGSDETVKEQIKMQVSTMECVNIDRNHVLAGESLSAALEAVGFAFYKHCQRKTAHLPF